MRTTLIFAFILMLLPCSTFALDAEDFDGTTKTLLPVCEQLVRAGNVERLPPSQYANAMFCAGYIQGVVSTVSVALPNGIIGGTEPHRFCLPVGITLIQEANIIVEYIKKHPEYRNMYMPADDAVLWALSNAYPCKK